MVGTGDTELDRLKHPRTPHLPWSPGVHNDDAVITNATFLAWNGPFIITEKLDGECTTMTRDFIHARSVDSRDHVSRHFVKGLWASIKDLLPPDIYIVGENTYAVHSIEYPTMGNYFYVFAIHNGTTVLTWDRTAFVAKLLGLTVVPLLAEWELQPRGVLPHPLGESAFGPEREGYVIRTKGEFPLAEWGTHVAKYVREHHVQTDEHWLHREVRRNGNHD